MKYVSIDIETTGLDPEKCQILQIGLIIEDTNNPLAFKDIPKLNLILLNKNISGSIKALTMNADLICRIDVYNDADASLKNTMSNNFNAKFINPEYAVDEIHQWLKENGIGSGNGAIKFNVAGKNFGTFDKRFLEKLPNWNSKILVRNRMLDPAILYVNWKTDECLPSLGECKQRAGIDGTITHDAIDDAWDVIVTLRKFYN
jgi:oligoribonuclease